MYGTCTQASGILATFWLYPSEPLMDIICSRTLYGRIQAAYGEYGVRTLFFCLIGYFLLLTSQEPIQNPWNGVIHSIQDFSSNNSIAIILQEFYKPLMLSILVHFYLSNFGVVRLPSSINIQFWSFGWLGFPQWLIHQIPLRTSQQVSRCVQHYLEQYMCDTLPFVHQHLQHPCFRSTSSTCPRKVNSTVGRYTSVNCSSCKPRKTREFWSAKCKSFGFPCQVCPTWSREYISFLTIITTVLGPAVLSSRSSQEEMPSNLKQAWAWLCHSLQSLRLAREPHNTLAGH